MSSDSVATSSSSSNRGCCGCRCSGSANAVDANATAVTTAAKPTETKAAHAFSGKDKDKASAGFLVKYEIREVPGKGMGCVALERVPKGKVVWHLSPDAAIVHDEESFRKRLEPLSLEEKRYLLNHVYGGEDLPGKILELVGDADLWNHSSNPNTGDLERYWEVADGKDPPEASDPSVNIRHCCIALRDIEIGEEITDSYAFYHEPEFYTKLCEEYGVESSGTVAKLYS